tara:strand:- start:108 stop:386 length:279 start_codon:yes stop_codon:yes gene_type:complete
MNKEKEYRYFNENFQPLCIGVKGPYKLKCENEEEWDTSGCPDSTAVDIRFKTKNEIIKDQIMEEYDEYALFGEEVPRSFLKEILDKILVDNE